MTSYPAVVIALVALVATLSATEMVRAFAHRLRAVDEPGGRRMHRRPTARMGGLGIFWGLVVALLLATYAFSEFALLHGEEAGVLGMLAGATLVLVVGMADDVRGLRPLMKLAFQVIGAWVLWAAGWRVDSIGVPGIGAWDTGAWSLPFTLAWVVLVTNAVNLIDGLDGLACGVALIATAALCALTWPTGGPLLIAAAAFGGALLGFLWFNLDPALIFMGDAGSLFVGFVLAALTMRIGTLVGPETIPLLPVLLLAVPLFDTFDAVRRRLAVAWGAGARAFLREAPGRVFAADSMHVHHRLARAGLSPRDAVAWLWLAAGAFAVSGCVLVHHRGLGYAMIVAGIVLGLGRWRRVCARGRRDAGEAHESRRAA